METTAVIPKELVPLILARAQIDGHDFQEEVTTLLRAGLASSSLEAPVTKLAKPRIEVDPETGFMVVRCPADAPARNMTAEQLIAIEKESLEQEDLERFGIPN